MNKSQLHDAAGPQFKWPPCSQMSAAADRSSQFRVRLLGMGPNLLAPSATETFVRDLFTQLEHINWARQLTNWPANGVMMDRASGALALEASASSSGSLCICVTIARRTRQMVLCAGAAVALGQSTRQPAAGAL